MYMEKRKLTHWSPGYTTLIQAKSCDSTCPPRRDTKVEVCQFLTVLLDTSDRNFETILGEKEKKGMRQLKDFEAVEAFFTCYSVHSQSE